MNPKAQVSHVRLWLYIGASCIPAIIDWLTLQFDTSLRGLLILGSKTLLTFCITTRAYLDGKTTDKVVEETIKTKSPDGTSTSKEVVDDASKAPQATKP